MAINGGSCGLAKHFDDSSLTATRAWDMETSTRFAGQEIGVWEGHPFDDDTLKIENLLESYILLEYLASLPLHVRPSEAHLGKPTEVKPVTLQRYLHYTFSLLPRYPPPDYPFEQHGLSAADHFAQ